MILKKIRPRLQNSGMLFFVSYVMPCRNILIVRVFVKSPLSFHCKALSNVKACNQSRFLDGIYQSFGSSRR
jgi:hypothetical protein